MEVFFSYRLSELRKCLNLTQSKMAEEIGTTQAALSAYEKGDRIPSSEILISIAQKYNVSIDWLCGLTDRANLEPTFSTYASVFDMLIKIATTKYNVEKPFDLLKVDLLASQTNYVAFSCCNDMNFKDFFTGWIKIYDFYSTGIIDKEVYDLWMEKELKKYNVPIDKKQDWMRDKS